MRSVDFGKRAGVTSGALGALCVLGTLCFVFPHLLVSKDAMPMYQENLSLFRAILAGTILTTFALGATSVILIRSKAYGLTGMALGIIAILMGGSKAEAVTDTPRAISAGLDYFILELLVLALVSSPWSASGRYARKRSSARAGKPTSNTSSPAMPAFSCCRS
jgi:hypothetical protein